MDLVNNIMSTATLTSSPNENRCSLLDQHKADILAGGDDLETGRNLGLLLGEIQANAATYARRMKLAHDLRVVVPQLEAEARAARDRSDRLASEPSEHRAVAGRSGE